MSEREYLGDAIDYVRGLVDAPGDPYQLYKDGVCAECDYEERKTEGATTRCRQCLHEFCDGCLPEHECADFEI